MCGIAGLLDLSGNSVPPLLLKRMTDAISHRGPDGEGHFIDGNFGLGHRRLSIIDLTNAGHQPMASDDGRYIISYNGEVYNFKELRILLESKGYLFHSDTDSEVVLKSIVEWGHKAFERFNGMFALALWDRKAKRLLLARDRYGIKPLYYCLIGSKLIFGSEVKSILQEPSYSVRLDKEALLEYLTFQNLFTDKTLFENVKLVPQGSYVQISNTSKQLSFCKYWDFDFQEPIEKADPREYEEELSRLFHQAVSRQLVSDVDVGSYLSGGIDSGAVTAVAAQQLEYIKSFTVGFDLNSASGVELNYDEREAAEYMSYLFKTEHYEMVLKSGDMERIMPRLTRHIEEPRVGQSYPNYYSSQLASKFVSVVLSGTGGDEMLGGYPWRYYRAVVNNDFDHYIDKYYHFWQRLIPNNILPDACMPIWADVSAVSTRDIFKNVFLKQAPLLTTPEDYINHSLYFEAKTFLHGLLVVEDKLSMSHSLETRVPFLDNDLVDFSMRIPASLKLGSLTDVVRLNENEPGSKTSKYFQKTKDGKLIFRKSLSKVIPDHVTQREKQGFSAPDSSWFKGESINYVKKLLYNGNPRIFEFLDKKTIHSLVDSHLSGDSNRRLLIWSLISLENWIKEFLPE